MAIKQDITIPNDPPSSTDRPNFRQRADAFVAWMKVFATQIASLIPQLNTVLASIESMYSSITNAYDTVIAAANFKGTWTNQTTQIGQSWLYNGVVYMVLIPGNTSPTTSPSNWLSIGVRTVNGNSPDASGNVKVEATKGTAIASASTITIGTVGLGDTIHITGTTTITSLGACTGGVKRTLIFDGILILTHNATSLILPDATNITTAVRDSAEFVCDTTNNWKLLRYTRAITPLAVQKDLSYKNTPITINSWSYSGTTITLNVTSHSFIAGDYIEIQGLTATTYPANGIQLVTSVTSTTIVFTLAIAPTGTAGVSSATAKGYVTINGRVSESIGVNQTWKNVTVSRVSGTTYTNSSGKPIGVSVSNNAGSGNNGVVVIGGVTILGISEGADSNQAINFIVPNNTTYSVTLASILNWSELR